MSPKDSGSVSRMVIDGGGARGPITTQPSLPMFRPAYPDVTDVRADRTLDLSALVAKCARHYLDTCPDLTPKQKQLLRDVEKGRYTFRALEQLLEIAPQARNPLALSDALRGATLHRLPEQPLCITDAWLDETRAEASANVMQTRFGVERIDTLRDATLDAVGTHLTKLQRYSDTLLRWSPNGRRYA